MSLDVSVIGTGNPDGEGFAMAYQHADGYRRRDDCELVACTDLVPENADRFASEYGIDAERAYQDHAAMLDTVQLDVVSVCVPPAVHAPLAIDCARAGVDVIHCEKPMADTWGAAREMAEAAWRNDIQLTFNHQRRFGPEWQEAKRLLDEGAIGDLQRIETAAPNLFDWGTHCFDLCGMFVDEASPEWVLGGLETSGGEELFGVYQEGQAVALWEYDNGVFGLASTGGKGGWIDCGAVDALHRLRGTDGTIAVNYRWGEEGELRIRRASDEGWQVPIEEAADADLTAQAIDHVIDAYLEGREPVLSARRALNATELVFGIYESVRRRGRVEFPLETDDHPLEDMLARGELERECTVE